LPKRFLVCAAPFTSANAWCRSPDGPRRRVRTSHGQRIHQRHRVSQEPHLRDARRPRPVYFGANGGCGLYADPEVALIVKAFFATYLAVK